jgi:anti-anti-sigma factor
VTIAFGEVTMLDPLSVESLRDRQVHRLIPFGELDIATTPLLERAFEEAVQGDAAKIVVDLTKLAFMDSSGIDLLLRMTEACADSDRLRIVNGSPAVVRVIDVTGVRDSLPIINSADDPLAPL